MNKSILILTILLICSCKSESKKETEVIDLMTEPLHSIEKADLNIEPQFDVAYIKSQTHPLQKELRVKDNSEGNFMPEEFVSQYIFPHKTDIGDGNHLYYYYPETYIFREYKEYEDFILFTFSHFDESCCINIYAVTTKKDTIDIINMGLIGFSGGDGGWFGEKYGEWQNETILKTITVSDYDEDFIEDNNNTQIDTVWTLIEVNYKGQLKETVIDSVSYIGDKRVK